MRGPGVDGEGELGEGNGLTQVYLGKWPLKRNVCVLYWTETNFLNFVHSCPRGSQRI